MASLEFGHLCQMNRIESDCITRRLTTVRAPLGE
jgi:hypothetical protein